MRFDIADPRDAEAGSPVAAMPQPVAITVRWFERVPLWAPGLLLAVSSVVMVVAYLGTPVAEGNRGLTNLTESFGALERVALWQDALGILPDGDIANPAFSFAPGFIAWAARFALVGMFVAQAWTFWLAWRGVKAPLWRWFIAPIAAHIAMIFLVPSNADVFFYEMSGNLAVNGVNPYAHALMEFPENPFLPFNHWIDMSTVYGPVWTMINASIMSIAGPNPVAATFAYKIILGIVALALAWVVHRFARCLTGREDLAIAASVLVAWQPNMIVESTGQAHNDPMVLLLSTLGVFLAIAGGTAAVRGGVILTMLSALIKYVTLPLLGLLALTRLADRKQPGGLRRIVTAWAVDGIAMIALLIAAFLPFWNGPSTLTEMLAEPGRLFTNPIWFDPYLLFDTFLPHWVASAWRAGTRAVMQIATILIVLIVVFRFGQYCWQAAGATEFVPAGLPIWTRHLLRSWTVVIATLALLPANSHPWYWTWPFVPIAILVAFERGIALPDSGTARSLPRWFWPYLMLTCIMTLAYHTRIVHL